MKNYQPIVGFEVHIELKTQTKMFCSCLADHFAKKPNTQVCPVCLGLPGALPVPNRKAVEWTVLAGLALDCKIPLFSKFDRKNYFYSDLPKGYQISQYDLPLAKKGYLGKIGIERIHLEEDTAKMIHHAGFTLLDFNRSGVPLMEIVTAPEIHSGEEGKEFLKKLRQIVRFLRIADADMEKGSMRIEPNISLGAAKASELPDYKVEIKNLNSFRFVQKALDFEIERQHRLLEAGKKPVQETRGWDEKKQVTFSQRAKETAQDYRYFPEPDIPPMRWTKTEITALCRQLPELPEPKVRRWQKELKISKNLAEILAATRKSADYFEESVKLGRKQQILPAKIAGAIINKRVNIEKILPAQLVAIMVKKKIRPGLTGKKLAAAVGQVLKKNPQPAADYKKGKKTAIEFLVGQVMKTTKGQADPKKVRGLIVIKLG